MMTQADNVDDKAGSI